MFTENKIEVRNLCYCRQNRSLFSNLSFVLSPCELLLVKGLNGSGKSSLLRVLTGLVQPASGEICWKNESILDVRKDYWKHLHYIGHSNGIKLQLTVFENLQLTAYFSSNDHSLPQTQSDEILSRFQLSEYKNTPTKFLSAGQRRRLALAKLLWVPKSIWILDEPTTALDTRITTVFLDDLRTHLTQGGIAIVSSHQDMTLENVTIKTLRLCS